jgi:hypothetical protein
MKPVAVRSRRRPRSFRPPTLPATLLRDAVTRQLATISLRQAAGEIGLSPNALRNFLAGAEPRTTTRAKLESWLATRATGEQPKIGALIQLVGELAVDLSPAQATALGRETARFLLEAYQARRLPPPRWVREMASHYHAPTPR